MKILKDKKKKLKLSKENFVVPIKKYNRVIQENLLEDQTSFCISQLVEDLKMFNVTSKYFRIFSSTPPPS